MDSLERARSEYMAELDERIEQLEQDANDWRENYLIAFARAEKAEDKLVDTAERCEQLEQLCNDLFNHVCAEQIGARVTMQQFVELSDRMDELGLLEDCHD